MSEETTNKEIFQKLRHQEEIFILASACTKGPYVVCDPETFDDEVYLFFREEDARKEAERLNGAHIPVAPAKLENKQMLMFYTSLFTMGVNALLVKDEGVTVRIQLKDVVSRKTDAELPEGTVWVENPQLHLTAIYYAQELRRAPYEGKAEKLKELGEELEADFRKGSFIVAVQKEEKGTPLVKMKDGQTFQPVFTDIMEFQKFNKGGAFRPLVIGADKVPKLLESGANGVVLNVLGVNLPLTMKRQEQKTN